MTWLLVVARAAAPEVPACGVEVLALAATSPAHWRPAAKTADRICASCGTRTKQSVKTVNNKKLNCYWIQ